MSIILFIAKLLTIIGGINWGLVGAFEYNLVEALLGAGTTATMAVYIAVGVAAVVAILDLFMPRRIVEERPVAA